MSALLVACGLPASGKSTWAKDFQERNLSTIIISTDAIRAELYGNESIQGDGVKVFQIAYERIERALKEYRYIIFDATNLHRKNRIELVKRFKKPNITMVCYYFNYSLETCWERNKNRERVVPFEVMKRMSRSLSIPSSDEGWDYVFDTNFKVIKEI